MVGDADRGSTVEVRQDGLLLVRLAETPTSGYRWTLEPLDEQVLVPEGSRFTAAAGAGPGAPGQRTFSFRAARPGTARVVLRLARPWEDEVPARDPYDVSVRVVAPA